MKKGQFSVEKILSILKEAECGMPAKELCRRYGFTENTFYRWKSKYGGMTTSEARRLKELEEENARLKKLVVDLPVSITEAGRRNGIAGSMCCYSGRSWK